MTTPITIANLLGAGFSLTGSMPRNALPADKQTILAVFSKGIMSIHLTDRSATACKLGTELGPVSTMEEVSILDSVINHVPSDVVTADSLLKSGWISDGLGRYFMRNIGINMQGGETHPTVFTSVGFSKVVLGYVSTMSEVEALTAIAKRGITKE